MNKKAKSLVPKLRFPEFRDSREWDKIKLIDTADKKKKWSFTGGPFGSNLKSSDYTNTGVRVIQLQNIGDAKFVDNYKIFTSDKKADELLSCNIYPGDIILSKMGDPVGRASLIPNKHSRYVMCSDGIRLVVNEDLYNKYFIYSLINSHQFRSTIENNSTGSTRKRISLDVLKNLPMPVPHKHEQQKIADCLSSLDEIITLEDEKHQAYIHHKKGLMQKLFPSKGETVPKLRFPEFRDSGEWEEQTLGQVAHYENGKAHEQDINEQGKYIVANSKFISTAGEVKKYSDTANLLANNGDILMVLSDVPNGRAIAKCFFVYKDNTYTVNQRICKLTPKKIVGLFLYYIVNRNNYFLAFDDGVKQTNLKKDDVLNCPILLPKNIKEQQKIADCLSSLDEIIIAQAQKIDTLNAQKKGLMQKLFPSTDEVSV